MKKREQGWSGNEIATHLQGERSMTGNKYAECNKEEMVNRPNKVEIVVDDRTRKFVLRLREKYDWGPCRIERYIRKFEPKGFSR